MIFPFDYIGYKRLSENKRFPNHRWYSDATWGEMGEGSPFRTPLFPHLVPPTIMVWIFVWKYIFEPFIHILQHFVLLTFVSRSSCRITYIYIKECQTTRPADNSDRDNSARKRGQVGP